MHDRDGSQDRQHPETREDRERDRIVNLPSPYSEILKLAGLDITDKATRDMLVRWIRESVEAFQLRERRSLKWSTFSLTVTGIAIGAVIGWILNHSGDLMAWAHGFVIR